jgi:hypothetical protein
MSSFKSAVGAGLLSDVTGAEIDPEDIEVGKMILMEKPEWSKDHGLSAHEN